MSKRASKALVAKAFAVMASLDRDGAYAIAAGSPDKPGDTFCRLLAEQWICSADLRGLAIRYRSRSAQGLGDRRRDRVRLRISLTGRRALHMRAEKGSVSSQRKDAGGIRAAPAEGALAWLRNRKDKDGRPLITEVQFNAGSKLAADYWHAQMSPKVTANWTSVAPSRRQRRSTPGIGVDMRDAVVAARERFRRALEAVGPELAGILVDVCCRDIGLEVSGQSAGWPQRAAKVVLDLALTRLARHYGMIAPEHPFSSRPRHWGDADYRPTLDAWR